MSRVERYESLAESEDYADTCLEHSFLREAVLEARERKKERRAEACAEAAKPEKGGTDRVQEEAASKRSKGRLPGRRQRRKINS
jgi:hypothetical protein